MNQQNPLNQQTYGFCGAEVTGLSTAGVFIAVCVSLLDIEAAKISPPHSSSSTATAAHCTRLSYSRSDSWGVRIVLHVTHGKPPLANLWLS